MSSYGSYGKSLYRQGNPEPPKPPPPPPPKQENREWVRPDNPNSSF